jgi:two-component system nitrogen regulation sensor histidine kinase GlnL
MVSPDSIINSLAEAVFLFDKKGRLIFMNRAGEEFSGKGFDEIKNRQFKTIFPDAEDIPLLIQKAIKEGRSFHGKEMEVDIGRIANVDLNISPYYLDEGPDNEGNNGAILSIRENLLLTEREDYPFDSMLYLLGSIAHEIKNPLSGIKGAAQILMRNLAHSSSLIAQSKNNETMSHELSAMSYLEASECVNLILKETDRLNSVMHSYLTMTRKPVLNRLNIHEVVEHALKVMKPVIEENRVAVGKSYDPSLPHISGDESKLLQVFINLIKNAVEAMKASKERTLYISTRPSGEYVVIYEKGDRKKSPATKKKRWAVIAVQDAGAGINKDDIHRIFMPFYTGKEGGIGLGLALSKKIVKDHGGIIKVKSEPGAGATFSVYLPF